MKKDTKKSSKDAPVPSPTKIDAGWANLYAPKPEPKLDPKKSKAFVPTAKPAEPAADSGFYQDDAILSISQPEKPTFTNKKK